MVLSCDIWEIFKNTYFEEYLRMTASVGTAKIHRKWKLKKF